MTLPAVVALTGGIGSGKSTVARLFAELDVPVLDGDLVARRIHQDPAHAASRDLARAFPHAVDGDGRLLRGSLRTLFARDPAANALLKQLLAPHVFTEARRWTALQSAPYVVWESALLLDYTAEVAQVVTVDAPDPARRARVAVRNPDWTGAEFDAVCALQPGRNHFLAQADHILSNDGDIDALRAQVLALHHLLQSTRS
jgi:dephospho-CoA kinase